MTLSSFGTFVVHSDASAWVGARASVGSTSTSIPPFLSSSILRFWYESAAQCVAVFAPSIPLSLSLSLSDVLISGATVPRLEELLRAEPPGMSLLGAVELQTLLCVLSLHSADDVLEHVQLSIATFSAPEQAHRVYQQFADAIRGWERDDHRSHRFEQLIRFATGQSTLPIRDALTGAVKPISLISHRQSDPSATPPLPVAHACACALRLPDSGYANAEEMRHRLETAIQETAFLW